MSDKDGGPAFPHEFNFGGGSTEYASGMTLRDYFASHCPSIYLDTEHWSRKELSQFLNVEEYDYRKHYAAVISKLQYEYADAMLKEREK